MDVIVEFNEAAFRHGISKEDILHAYRNRMCERIIMARITEEEAWVLDEVMTNTEITLGPNGSGWLSQRELRLLGLKNMTINYLVTKAEASQKSPAQIIDELVGKEMAATI
jgi:hypothetical protein